MYYTDCWPKQLISMSKFHKIILQLFSRPHTSFYQIVVSTVLKKHVIQYYTCSYWLALLASESREQASDIVLMQIDNKSQPLIEN